MNQFMLRALELATLGRGHVSPNPMVGCVIVHGEEGNQRIIGEGWHQRYGEAHAERNAILSVRPEDTPLLPESTAYVTLEPCSHYGKQPPCADLLIEKRIKRVVCCNDDPNPLVSGQGFDKLRSAGISVETGVLAPAGRALNARFFTFIEGAADHKKRPYIILKWAETTDGFIGAVGGKPVKISGDLAHRLVHQWRSEEDAIMVGTNTARNDNPRLDTRLWPIQAGPGKNPIRIVIDNQLSLDQNLNLFDGTQPTIVYHQVEGNNVTDRPNLIYAIAPRSSGPSLNHVVQDLHQRNIQSVLVEGGATLLQSFMDAELWDEMRVFRSRMMLGEGVYAPRVQGTLASREMVGDDELTIYKNSPGI